MKLSGEGEPYSKVDVEGMIAMAVAACETQQAKRVAAAVAEERARTQPYIAALERVAAKAESDHRQWCGSETCDEADDFAAVREARARARGEG